MATLQALKRKISCIALVSFCSLYSCRGIEEKRSILQECDLISDTLWIEGSVGMLHTVITRPVEENQQYPAILIFHGLQGCKDSTLHRMLAKELALRGLVAIRFDFNGHGKSEGRFQDMTIPKELADARKMIAWAKKQKYIKSISLSGHSQGGIIAGMLAGELGEKEIKAVALLAPAANIRDGVLMGDLWGVRFDPFVLPNSVEIWEGDRLGNEYIRTVQNLPIYPTAKSYTGSACIIHGDKDDIVPITTSENFNLLWEGSEFHIIQGGNHVMIPKQKEAIDILTAFFEKALKEK